MDLKKAIIDDKMTNVVELDTILERPNDFPARITSFEYEDMILPVKSTPNGDVPGLYIYPDTGIGRITLPAESEMDLYSRDGIIDFSDAKTMQDVISKQEEVKKAEATLLLNSDNVFILNIKENDSPEMKAMKEAINCKHIDIDAYSDRMGPNHNNDKRLLKGSSITMQKLKSICQALDISCSLTIKDASENVPNPIGKEIVVDITAPVKGE